MGSAGKKRLNIPAPPVIANGTSFARFRLSTAGGLTPTVGDAIRTDPIESALALSQSK